MVISSRFQSTTDCPDPGLKAADDREPGPCRAVAASAGAATPATTAAVTARTRALPVLRTLELLSTEVGRRHRPARAPGRVGPGLPTNTFSTWWVFIKRTDSALLSATGQLFRYPLGCCGWAPAVIVSRGGAGTDGQRGCQRSFSPVRFLAISSTPRGHRGCRPTRRWCPQGLGLVPANGALMGCGRGGQPETRLGKAQPPG